MLKGFLVFRKMPKYRIYLTSNRLFSNAQRKSQEKIHFRTPEENPLNHTSEHVSQYYYLKEGDKKQLFTYGGLPKSFEIKNKVFNETSLMVRQPSINVINCMRKLDFSNSAVRFVLYGKKGSGKTLSLAHILHYALKDNFLIVHVPWVSNWMCRCKEFSNSETKEGFIDLNVDAAAWLLHFKTQNAQLLRNPNFTILKDQVWSKREVTVKGSPLLSLVDHGINRIKYSSDCVTLLCNEIKRLSNSGVCKTLVAVDGYNTFFNPNTRIYTDKKEMVHPHKVTLTEGFLTLSKSDWKNSVIVVTVDEITIAGNRQISHLPRYLLGKKGFEYLDPFLPVLVSGYSNKELLSCLNYYRERKWIPIVDQEEISFIGASNPYRVMQICEAL